MSRMDGEIETEKRVTILLIFWQEGWRVEMINNFFFFKKNYSIFVIIFNPFSRRHIYHYI